MYQTQNTEIAGSKSSDDEEYTPVIVHQLSDFNSQVNTSKRQTKKNLVLNVKNTGHVYKTPIESHRGSMLNRYESTK